MKGFGVVRLMSCAVGTALAFASFGATVSKLQSTDSARNAYVSNGNLWTGGVTPNADTAKNYDFVVAADYYLWCPEESTARTIGGNSMQFGDSTTTGTFYIKGDKRWLTFPDLRLYRGSFVPGNNNWWGLAGNATVYSGADAPFVISFRKDYDGYVDMKLTGDDNAVIQFSQSNPEKTGWLFFYGNQSQTYSGSWVFGPGSTIRPTYDANRGAIRSSTDTFGKAPAVFNPKGVVAGSNTSFRVETYNRTFLASDNRGLWLDAPGSTVSYVIINNNNTHDFGWPIGGAGTFALTGSGTFLLRSKCDVPINVGAGVALRLEAGAELNGGLAATSAGSFRINQTVDAQGGAGKPIRLGCNLDVSRRPVAVSLTQNPSVAAETDIPVAVIDKAVAADYTEADFDPWGAPGAQIANAKQIVFSTNGDGDTVVSVRVFPYVGSAGGTGTVTLDNAGQWVPVGKPSSGQNYIVWNNQLRTGGTDWQSSFAVPGDQWVFSGSGSYATKHFDTVFANARLLDGTSFAVAAVNDFRSMSFSGNIDIRTTKNGVAYFTGASIIMIQNATLTGRGNLRLKGVSRNPSVTTSDYRVEMKGDASGFVGYVCATNFGIGTVPMVFKAAGETNFGGNPETFAADALRICPMVALTPSAAMVIDDANRGVTFANSASVDTTSGDCTIKTPVVFEGAFTKAGTGTFAYGAGGATMAAGAAFAVNGGILKAEGVHALKGASVSFADGTVLAVNAGMGALDLATTTLSKAGSKYLVRIDGLTEDAALATFASAQAAADFVANAQTVKGTGHKGRLVTEGVTVKVTVPGTVIHLR